MPGSSERYNVIIGLEFAPGRAVQQATGVADEIRGVFRRLNNQGVDINVFDPRVAQQFGAELRRAIERATSVDVRNSPLFRSLNSLTYGDLSQRLISGTGTTATSRFLTEQIRVAQAELERQRVAQRSEIPLGGTSGGVRGYRTVDEMLSAQLRATAGVEAANRSLVSAQQRYAKELARAEAEQAKLNAATASTAATQVTQGRLRRIESDFMTGFRGHSDRPYAEQIGQAFKFSVFYGTAYKLLFALTQTFQQTLQEGIAFQQAVTELKLSAGRVDENIDGLAEQLGARAAQAGFAPSQGVLVGARSLGLYGVTQAPLDEQARVADISARVVSRLAMGSPSTPADLQANIAAITQAFGLGAEGQFRVADLDAYFAHLFGIAPGQAIQAVSEAGTVGRAAGFSQEQVTAIAADMISRTGQTPAAVAGFMAQIFSRGGEGSLTSVANKFGIDPTLKLSQQIERLADIYAQATPQERAEISAAFGRGKVQNAAIALLQDYDAVRQGAEGARTGAAGAADRAFDLRLSNIGGQIDQTLGTVREFANELGQSGLLSVLGGAIVVTREFTEAGTELLRLWNELPGPIKATAASLLLLAAASRTAAGGAALQGGANALGLFRGAGGLYAGGAAIGAGRLGVAAAAGGAAAPLASRAGLGILAGNAGSAVAGSMLANPMLWAIGGLVAVGALRSSSEKLKSAQESASAALNEAPLGPGATADDYRARAAALTAAANDQRSAASGFLARSNAFLTGSSSRSNALSSADRLDTEAARLQALATRVERTAGAAASSSQVLLQGFDPDSLAASMQQIDASGGTAQQRLEALRASLLGTADAADRAASAFNPEQFAQESSSTIQSILAASIRTARTNGDPLRDKNDLVDPADFVQKNFGGDAAAGALKKRLAGLNSLADLSFRDAGKIAEQIVRESGVLSADEGVAPDLDGSATDDYQGAIRKIRRYLLAQAAGVKDVVRGARVLTPSELTAVVNQIVSDSDALSANLAETDYRGRIQAARTAIRDINRAIARSGDGATPQVLEQLGRARRNLVEAQIAQLEAMRRVAQQNARSRGEVSRIGRSFFQREVAAAVRGRDQDALVRLVGLAGEYGKRVALKSVEDAMAIIREAMRVREAALRLALAQQAALSAAAGRFMNDSRIGMITQGLNGQLDELANLQGMADAINGAVHGDPDTDPYTTGSDIPGYQAPKAPKDRKAEAEARRQAALAVAQNLVYLKTDLTDPLEQAQAALKAALLKLRSDRGHVGRDVLTQDKLDIRRAQAELEATKFQQRLEAIQTAEDLGRISHQKYISYLENERKRLNAIKDRTYQQQQQLDQIDGLLKEAAETMQGQWNFGDINLPTPYQVRRYIEQNFPSPGQAAAGASARGNTTTIYINGADTGMVRRVIDEHVGRSARTTATAPRHR